MPFCHFTPLLDVVGKMSMQILSAKESVILVIYIYDVVENLSVPTSLSGQSIFPSLISKGIDIFNILHIMTWMIPGGARL
jgi:hypothetical protein